MAVKKCSVAAALALVCFMSASIFGAGQTINVPRRPVPPPATVAVIKDNSVNYGTMVSQALEAALGTGGIGNLVHSGTTVLIKPNLVTNTTLAVTDWHVVRALVDQIQAVNGGADITIAEGSAGGTATKTNMAAQGFTATNFPGVTLADLNDLNECPTNDFVLADGTSDNTVKRVAARIYEANVYIDMPKMKTHYHAGFTGAVKNLGIGTAPWPIWNNPGYNTNKGGLHNDIRREIVDHILCRVPDLSVMDAVQAMEGQGPASGTAVTMNLVLASTDPVALDAVACSIMGIPPYLITHLVLAANENVGVIDLNNITVTGNATIASVQHNFVRATPGGCTSPYEMAAIPYRATTVIRTAPATMTIDGDLSEWAYANTITINGADQVKGSASWGGPSDCSANGQFLYDDQNLYIAMNVHDNVKLNNSASGAAIRNGECLEIYLSTYAKQYDTTHGTTYNAQYDHVFGISYSTTPQVYFFSHNRAATGAVVSKVETSDGYIIEAKIPWSNFNGFTLTPYRQIGINVAIDDADVSPTTVDRKLLWNKAKDADIETNPQKLGMAYLDPAGGIYPPLLYSLTVPAANGTVAKNPDQTSYSPGTVVSLAATPASGYAFYNWSGDASGSANPLSVTLDKNKTITANFRAEPVLTSIAVSPGSASVNLSETKQFSAVASDQYGAQVSPQPAFTWSVNGGGSIDAGGLFTAGSIAGGPYTVTATAGQVSGAASVTVVTVNQAPTIATAASASPNPVTGTTTALTVLGADDNGETNLTYTWAATGTPPAAVTFSANGTNAAKNCTATFTNAGNYTLQVTVKDQGNLTVTSPVTVTVNQTLTSIAVSPSSATVTTSATQQFTAAARDQFATTMTTQPAIAWSVSGGGTVSSGGLFTAGTAAGGPFTVTASSGGKSGTASVTVAAASPVYQINCGSSNAASPFTADQYGTGGTMRTVTNTIDLSGVSNPAPQAVYQSERYGTSTYTLPGLTVGAQYKVRLHFAELYQTASGKRVFNVAINGSAVLANFDIFAAVGAQYKATVREFTATANGSGQIVITFTTVTDNATIEGIEIVPAAPNAAPTIVTAASASPNPVTGTTTALSALGADDNGEANLTYTWATTGTPPAAVTFSVNGTNAAKNCTATFTKAGSYTLLVTVKDQGNLTVTSPVTVTVNQTLTSIIVSPSSATVTASATQQFTATARDQFAATMTAQPTFAWSVSGGGTISSSGLFTAGTTAGGPYTVTATGGSIIGTAGVTVQSSTDPCAGVQGGGGGLKGTAFGLNPPWAAGSEYCKATDGNINTFYDYSQANGAYTGLDLGSATVIGKIRYYPRATFASRMTGGKFQGSNTSSSSGFVDLYAISTAPAVQWNEVTISNSTAYRWVRYLAPDGGYGNIAEMEFYAPATQYTITASSGANGSISPAGSVKVNSGASQTFTITPNSGYAVGAVTVDGANKGAITTYSFTNVTANHTISATFTLQLKIEAENATLSGSANKNTNHAGYSGTGFIDGYYNSTTAQVSFTVNAPSAGNYTVKLHYSAGNGASSNTGLYVNGVKIKNISCAATANWDTWADESETVTLNAGNNTIAYKAVTSSGSCINLDYCTISQ